MGVPVKGVEGSSGRGDGGRRWRWAMRVVVRMDQMDKVGEIDRDGEKEIKGERVEEKRENKRGKRKKEKGK
jgi:hypothetical protein